jgi:hypothetical protein
MEDTNMKRDMDLIRTILLTIENNPDFNGLAIYTVSPEELAGDDQPSEVILYNVTLLQDAGLIEGRVDNGTIYLKRLTFAGHDFVDTVRTPEIWRKVKDATNKIGGFTVEILVSTGKALLKQQVQEKLGIALPEPSHHA